MENEIRQKNDERLAKILQAQENNTNINNPSKSSTSVQNPYVLEELPDIDIMRNNSRLHQNNYDKQVNRKIY
jgi:hypothetical protein